MKDLRTTLSALFLILLPALLLATGPVTRQFNYPDAWGERGFNLTYSGSDRVEIIFSITSFSITDVTINGNTMQEVSLPEVFLPGDAGAPNLPGTGRFIALPEGASPMLTITGMRTETIPNVWVSPAPRIPLETEEGLEYSMNEAIYSSNAPYPAEPVKLSDITDIRGVDAAMLGVTPFQYNPVTKELTVIRDLRVEIRFEEGEGTFGEDRLRSRWWDRILKDVFLNYSALPKINHDQVARGPMEAGAEYLIITPDISTFIAWADTIRRWRNTQGISTKVVTMSDIGSNTTTAIESYINNAYNTWVTPPSAVLLMADYGTGGTTSAGITSPIYDNYCISDHTYADVSGNHMADIAFARLTAQNETQLATMIDKFIGYETNPPTNPDFYNKPITAMGWQTERWFQLCSETINGFFQYELGKQPVRENAIYSGTPGGSWSTATNTSTVVNYFGPTGLGYIPSTTAHLTDWGGNATRVNADINSGAFLLQHRDHGFESGWGEPDYTSSNVTSLNNDDLVFVFSINCLTGKFNYSNEVFAETFHRYPNRALGIIAATEVSYSFVNDAYTWGMYDYMWPQFMPAYGTPGEHSLLPAFANVAGKYFLQQSSWPYNTSNKEVTYYLFHHHGDAFTTVYSEMPQYLTVVHNPVLLAGVSTFDVSADSGALICLSHDGEILATATATGAPVTMNIVSLLPGDDFLITVTKQNYYRYSQQIQVIPPAGPYVIKHAVILNDPNQNGQADFGEEVMLSLELKNVGIAAATAVDVTISTQDGWVNILDSTESYGNIASDSMMSVADAFTIRIADSIADKHIAVFNVKASDTGDTWYSSFTLMLHAPVIELPGYTVIDTAGNNNGLAEPGETVTLHVHLKNDGTADAPATTHHLVSSSPYLSISGSPFIHNGLAPGSTLQGEFTVAVDPNTPDGVILDLITEAHAGPYQDYEIFLNPVGEIVEDFESGGFQSYNWVTGGTANWIISSSLPYEGSFSARSGYIGNNASTYLQITLDVLTDDTISFFRRVSSEANYDFLEFYIDNTKLGQWSGNVNWSRVSYPVTAGMHTFKWVYDKDVYMTGGSDAAWVDYIEFPPIVTSNSAFEVRAAAIDNELCAGESTSLYAIVTGGSQGTSLLWMPAAGLSNTTVFNPQASPMAQTNYMVIGMDGALSDTGYVTVNVNPLPDVHLGPADTSICATATLQLNASVPNGSTYLWSPGGSTAPMITVDSTGTGFGSATYSVTVTDQNACSNQESITVTFVDCAGLDDIRNRFGISIYPNPASGRLFVQAKSPDGEAVIRLLDNKGAVLREARLEGKAMEVVTLDLSGLSKGMYFLQVSNARSQHTEKLIIQ